MPSVDQETQQIIATYQTIYNLIFRYGIFIILGVVSFVIVLTLNPRAYSIYNADSSFSSPENQVQPLLISGNTYIAKGITLSPNIATTPLDISILQGFVDLSPEAQMGYGLLASQKGIILPVSINLSTHEDNFSKEYFEAGEYRPEELDELIQNTILTYPVKNIQNTLYRYKQETADSEKVDGSEVVVGVDIRTAALPIDSTQITRDTESLSDRFGLECLGNRHLTDYFCHRNTEVFISRIPYLSLTNNLNEMRNLMEDIAQTPYKDIACDNLQYSFSRTAVSDR